MKQLFPLFLALILTSCNSLTTPTAEGMRIEGAWLGEELSELRIYGENGVMYRCAFTAGPSGMTVEPEARTEYQLISKGEGEYLYFEDDEPRPLTVINDTTITIQRHGEISMWVRSSVLTDKRIEEIRRILETDNGSGIRYVFSVAEKELKEENSALTYTVFGTFLALLFVAHFARESHRRRKSVERQLRQLTEERENRPQLVAEALQNVETDFHSSEYYQSLRRRIATGRPLTSDEWSEIEAHTNRIYPSFSNKLNGLHHMSEVEMRACLLIKLRVPPTEMSAVLCREASTVSTVRSRLYQKVFGRKGSARDWDEFILTL